MTEILQENTDHLSFSHPLNEKDMEDLILQYQSELRFSAFKYVRDWVLVDDIMQEVYLKVFLHMNSFENRSTIKS